MARALALLLLAGCGPVSPFDGEGSPGHAEPSSLGDATAESNGVDRGLLVGATPRQARTIAALMFDIGGGPPDKAQIQELLTGEDSLRQMYREISYGMQDLTIDLLGPYTLPEQTCLPIECCGPKTEQPNGPAVQEIIADLPKTYDHYFWVYGRIPQGAVCGTWGDEGRPGRYAKYSSYSFHGIVGYAQELGHNFGMTHEPIMTCPNNATFVDDPSQCTHSEYGSQLSFMGSGPMHTSGYHKVAQGWLSGCNGVTVGGSGTYTLLPTEIPCDGVQILQIQAPKTRSAAAAGDRQGSAPMLTHYYLELRTPRSFDARYTDPQVFISVGPDFRTDREAPYVYQLNRTPDNNNRPSLSDGGYKTGQSFMDPAGGLTFTFDSVTNDQATVTVTRTAAGGTDTCLNDMAFTGPGPGPDSCGLPVPPGTGGAAGAAGTGGGAGSGAGSAGASAGGMPGAGGMLAAGAGGVAAGAGGTAGASGSAGSSAGAATGGVGGSAGTLSAAGTGTGGSASGGAPGAGIGGAPSAGAGAAPGSGGSAGALTGGGADPGATSLEGGCGCRMAGERRREGSLASVGALALAFGLARRRRRTVSGAAPSGDQEQRDQRGR
jgi:MYXO-CTERM domain-containing protein